MPFVCAHRCFTLFLLLGYLLCGSGLAHALVWCVDAEGHSHVAINPAGSCQTSCNSVAALPLPSETVWDIAPTTKQCLDIILLADQTSPSRDLDTYAPLGTPLLLLCLLAYWRQDLTRKFCTSPRQRHTRLPETTTLAALRTIVLLN